MFIPWKADENDAQAEVNLTLELPDGSLLWPVQRVMKRFQHGAWESLHGYASAVIVSVVR